MKLLIGVTTCHRAIYPEVLSRQEPPNNTRCHDTARETWIKDAMAAGIDVRFFFGRGATRDPMPDEVFLDVDDSYDGLIDKVREIAAWAYDHDYDYFMKVDIDSYVNIKNLLASEFRDWDYTGRGWGLGYILSRKAMKLVAAAKRRLSWAEDSHALRVLFAYGHKVGPENKIKLYGDGRYIFIPALPPAEIELYDRAYIVVNPMTPKSMKMLHETGSLKALMPFDLATEDLWTQGIDRARHCSVFNAYTLLAQKCPVTYDQWLKLTIYERQPYLDWLDVVHACLETDQLDDCPDFTMWMGPIEERKKIMDWAKKVNADAALQVQAVSKEFREKHMYLSPFVDLSDVTICITTFLRPGYLKACIDGIEANLPECQAQIISDSGEYGYKGEIVLKFDSGLSAKRNAGVKACTTKYWLCGCDDFDFSTSEARQGIERMVAVLNENPGIDVAAGRVNNRPYEGMLEYKPGEYIREHCAALHNGRCTVVDLTVNYFIGRTEVIKHFPWPAEMKIGGEHVCFFFDLKRASRKVVFVPDVNINTSHLGPEAQDPRYGAYRARAQSLGHELMKKRYNIKKYIDFDGGVS